MNTKSIQSLHTVLHIIKIKAKQLTVSSINSCWLTLHITYGPWCVTLWNSHLEIDGSAIRMCPHFLLHSSTVEHWVSCLHLWSWWIFMKWGCYFVTVGWKHLEQVWKCFKILMQKCIKWWKLYCTVKYLGSLGRKTF